jgi:hypothetical protein
VLGCSSNTHSKERNDLDASTNDGGAGRTASGGNGGMSSANGGVTSASGGAVSGATGRSGGSGGAKVSGVDGGGIAGAPSSPDAGVDAGPPSRESPFGIASSASSSRSLEAWASDIAATGIGWLRGFDGSATDKHLTTAAAAGLQVSGILFFSGPGSSATFPIADLPGWDGYVESTVTQCKGRVGFWEVWNEPPNFTADTSPADYATIVVHAYDRAKAVDASVRIGLAAQSNNVSWLEQTIDAGAKGHYDYVTVHPYEILGLVADGWEAEYMSIVPTLRKMLAAKDPEKVNVPVWFTEVGEPVGNGVTPEHQAATLVKAYTMGIAQGVLHVHWFEGKDGDSGPFGLIDGSGAKRPSYTAMKTLIAHLGAYPRYLGWYLVNDRHYGFVFQRDTTTVMVAWGQPGASDMVDLGQPSLIVDPNTGAGSTMSSVKLTPSPIIVEGVPPAWASKARSNHDLRLPWNGDHASAGAVTFEAPDLAKGLHPLGTAPTVTIDGVAARDQSSAPGQSFTVDPSFLSYTSTPITITAVVRRNGADSAGFNLKYESTKGPSSTGSWYSIPGSDQWYTQSFDIDDDEFTGKWGYNFSFDSDSTSNSKYSIRSVTITKR